QKAIKMLERNFEPGSLVALHHKDIVIVTAAAREAGVVTPLGSLVAQLMASALANGDGGLDHSALLLGVEWLSGKETGQWHGCERSTRRSESSRSKARLKPSACRA